jgi:hypothetical protein
MWWFIQYQIMYQVNNWKRNLSLFILGDVMNSVYIVKVEAIHGPLSVHLNDLKAVGVVGVVIGVVIGIVIVYHKYSRID